jgi:hypothetical protein
MTIQIPIFGNQLGLNHNGELVVNPYSQLTGYTEEALLNPMGLQKTTITSAQLLALNATPQIIVSAPPTGFANLFMGMALYKPAGTAYAGIAATEDLAAKYTDGSGQQVSAYVEPVGFLDQTTAQIRYVGPVASIGTTTAGDVTPVGAAAIVLQMLVGEITTGTGGLIVWAYFRRIPTVLTV